MKLSFIWILNFQNLDEIEFYLDMSSDKESMDLQNVLSPNFLPQKQQVLQEMKICGCYQRFQYMLYAL